MTSRTHLETEEREARIQEAVAGVKSKRYRSANQAAIELNVPHSLVCDRLNGIQPRNKSSSKSTASLTQRRERVI
jgi:hypothetical protein